MKLIQKFVLPVLIVIVIFLIFKIYFSPDKGLGSFTDFDPNNNAVKPIRVQLLYDRGINQQGGAVSFYVSDKDGKVVMVNGEFSLPEGFDSANEIIIKGHLSQNGFHAHEVEID